LVFYLPHRLVVLAVLVVVVCCPATLVAHKAVLSVAHKAVLSVDRRAVYSVERCLDRLAVASVLLEVEAVVVVVVIAEIHRIFHLFDLDDENDKRQHRRQLLTAAICSVIIHFVFNYLP
jgi:hypothetical protein